MDAGAARLGRAGDRSDTLGAGPAAVEADEGVAAVDCDRGAVEELLDREALRRDARGLANLQGALRCGPLVRPGPRQLEQAQRRLHSQLTLERRLDRGGHRLEPESRAQRLRELRQAQQSAEVPGGESRAALLIHRLDVDARRAAAADHHDGRLRFAELVEQGAREALGVPVAQHEHGVTRPYRQPVESGVHGLDRDGIEIGLAQEPDSVVGSVPARTRADDEEAPAGETFGLPLDRTRIVLDRAQVVRLAPDRRAHGVTWSTRPVALLGAPASPAAVAAAASHVARRARGRR